MPRNTSNSRTSTTATYGQIHPESNRFVEDFANYRPQVDPTIGFRAGESKRRLSNTFLNPLGGNSTPQRDEAIRRAGEREIDQQAAMQTRAGQFDVNQQRMGQLGSLASLMAPRVVQTGGTSQGNSSTGQNLFGNLLDVGLGAANMAMF